LNILVTGNLGYIGSVLTRKLELDGYNVFGYDIGYYKNCLISKPHKIKNQIIKDIKFESEGFSIEIELLAKTIKKTKKYHEYPIEYFARTYEEGKKIKFEDGIRYFIAILKYRN